MRYDPLYIREFYNRYGMREWERLERTAYGRLQFALQWHFVKKYLPQGARVLDAGGGPGRFAIELARAGAEVVLLDISPVHLGIAKERLREAGGDIVRRVELLEGDICDLPFGDESFDLTLALGGPLSYVLEKAGEALNELRRVTKRGGHLILSVMSNFGGARWAVKLKALHYFREPEGYDLLGPHRARLTGGPRPGRAAHAPPLQVLYLGGAPGPPRPQGPRGPGAGGDPFGLSTPGR